MRKFMIMAFAAAVAASVWADRTANREWVGRNFAPSNLVPRVEALEAKGGEETDPVFGAWRGGASVIAGQGAEASGGGCVVLGGGAYSEEANAIVIGNGADAQSEEAIAIGKGAWAHGWGTVQIGPGCNSDDGSLKFRGWTVCDNEGNVPLERLRYAVPSKPHQWWDDYGCVGRAGIACFEPNAAYSANPVCGMDECGIWNHYFRAGEEGIFVTFGGSETQIVDTDGKVNPDCLPELHVTEIDPVFVDWRSNGENIAIGKGADASEGNAIAIGVNASSYINCVALGKSALANGPATTAVGKESIAAYPSSSAFGAYSCAAGHGAIQLGCGTNVTERTLQFLDWRLVGSDGKIPTERLAAASVLSVIKGMSEAQIAELKELLK